MAIKRLDTPYGRYYDTPAGRLPSVTHILKVAGKAEPLMAWAANRERELVVEAAADLYLDLPLDAKKMSRPGYISTLTQRLGKVKAHERESQRAADIGSQVHKWVERELRVEMGQVSAPVHLDTEEARLACEAFTQWRGEHNFKPRYLEQMVFHAQHRHAGTLDCLGEVDGELAIVDFKTSKAVYDEYRLQCAAYGASVKSMGHGDPRRGYILKLPKLKDQSFEAVEVNDLDTLYPVFLSLLDVWEWLHRDDGPLADQRSKLEAIA